MVFDKHIFRGGIRHGGAVKICQIVARIGLWCVVHVDFRVFVA